MNETNKTARLANISKILQENNTEENTKEILKAKATKSKFYTLIILNIRILFYLIFFVIVVVTFLTSIIVIHYYQEYSQNNPDAEMAQSYRSRASEYEVRWRRYLDSASAEENPSDSSDRTLIMKQMWQSRARASFEIFSRYRQKAAEYEERNQKRIQGGHP